MVNAGYQDYFFSLYNQTLIPAQALDIVPSVVDAIITAIRVRRISLIIRSLIVNGYITIPQRPCIKFYLNGFRQFLDKELIYLKRMSFLSRWVHLLFNSFEIDISTNFHSLHPGNQFQ